MAEKCDSPKKADGDTNACRYEVSDHGLNECLPSDYKYSSVEGYGMDESRRSAHRARESTKRHNTLMGKDREMVRGADPHHPAGVYVPAQEAEINEMTAALQEGDGLEWGK